LNIFPYIIDKYITIRILTSGTRSSFHVHNTVIAFKRWNLRTNEWNKYIRTTCPALNFSTERSRSMRKSIFTIWQQVAIVAIRSWSQSDSMFTVNYCCSMCIPVSRR